jgi:hypothetical protein
MHLVHGLTRPTTAPRLDVPLATSHICARDLTPPGQRLRQDWAGPDLYLGLATIGLSAACISLGTGPIHICSTTRLDAPRTKLPRG